MYLSLNYIRQQLEPLYTCVYLGSRHLADEERLSAPALWTREGPLQRELCYIAQAQQIKAGFHCPPDTILIVAGSVPPEHFKDVQGAVLLLTDIPATRPAFSACFNRITQIFQENLQIRQQFSSLMMGSPSLQELISLAERVFRAPILVFDRNFCILNRVSPSLRLNWITNPKTQEKMLPNEIVEVLRTHPDLRHTIRDRLSVRITTEYLPYTMQFIQIVRGGTIFTVAIVESDVSLNTLSPQLIDHFTDCVYSLLVRNNFHTGHSLQFETFLKMLLDNVQVEQAVINQYLQGQNWLNSDHYICAAFEVDWWDSLNVTHYNVCRQIESAFAHSFVFHYRDRILAIINLDKAMATRGETLRRLVLFLREQVFHAGVSYTFWDFSTLYSYYLQTVAALEMGRLYRPDEWCYRFEDFVLPYFMHYGTTQINGRHLCHPGLVQLCLYDLDNHTELLKTLEVYLNTGLSAAKAARQLYIHRNTFYQRLETINHIINADLNDPDVRLFMMMSYSFVELLGLKPIDETQAAQAKQQTQTGVSRPARKKKQDCPR